MFNKSLTVVASALALATTIGCSEVPKQSDTVTETKSEVSGKPHPLKAAAPAVDRGKLFYAVQNRSDEDKARNEARKPIQTLEFFKVAPGMSVAEALPGGGWYSKILAYYLGAEGQLHGINYNDDMWARFGFFDEEGIQQAI